MEAPGEKLLTKIWETLTEKGIGSLFAPWQIRREGIAHAEVRAREEVLLAQAEKDAQEILAGRKIIGADGRLALPPAQAARSGEKTEANQPTAQYQTPQALIQDAASKFSARELQRHINLQRMALYSEEQARGIPDEEVSDKPVDDDWLNRWRENAQDVSNEHMQKVWARILAEEARQPGSYSMATLAFLRTLSKSDALNIAAIGNFVLNGDIIYRDQPYFDSRQMLFHQFLQLQEMGIISGVEALGLTQTYGSTIDKFRMHLAAYNKALLVERDTKLPNLEIPIYRLTNLGRGIVRLGDYTADDAYMRYVAEQVKRKGFKVRYGDLQGTRITNLMDL
jgi:hypothetical protein